MDRVERMLAVLERRRPDRSPVSFWRHFAAGEVAGRAAVRAHIEHLESFGLDFLKIMNDNGYPLPHDLRPESPIRDVRDLAALEDLRGDEPEFARQLELVANLRGALHDEVLMTTTVFNAWAVLRQLISPPRVHRPPDLNAGADAASRRIRDFLVRDPVGVQAALQQIAANLGRFARRCLNAGADGVFLSVRDDWLDARAADALEGTTGRWRGVVEAETPWAAASLYAELVRPADLVILDGVAGARLNVLHVCGRPIDFRAFAEYPVSVINWADRAAGPAITEVAGWARPALCAGVDNLRTLPDGAPDDCAREVFDAVQQAGERPLIVAAGCTYDPQRVPPANLEAVVAAARAASLSFAGRV